MSPAEAAAAVAAAARAAAEAALLQAGVASEADLERSSSDSGSDTDDMGRHHQAPLLGVVMGLLGRDRVPMEEVTDLDEQGNNSIRLPTPPVTSALDQQSQHVASRHQQANMVVVQASIQSQGVQSSIQSHVAQSSIQAQVAQSSIKSSQVAQFSIQSSQVAQSSIQSSQVVQASIQSQVAQSSIQSSQVVQASTQSQVAQSSIQSSQVVQSSIQSHMIVMQPTTANGSLRKGDDTAIAAAVAVGPRSAASLGPEDPTVIGTSVGGAGDQASGSSCAGEHFVPLISTQKAFPTFYPYNAATIYLEWPVAGRSMWLPLLHGVIVLRP